MPVLDIQDAISLLEKREAREAAHLLEEMVAEMPAYATARVLLARAYEALDDWDLALAVWREALQIVPNSPVVRRGLERSTSRSGSRRRRARAEAEAAASMPDTAAAATGETSAPADSPRPATPAEPHAAAPPAAEPHAEEPDAFERHAEEPDTGEPHAQELDAGEPHAEELDAGDSLDEDLDAGAPHAGAPHGAAPDAAEPKAAELDAAEPDAQMPETAKPDTEMPEAAEPDAEMLDTAEADVAEPAAAESHTDTPDEEAPDAGEPEDADADAGEQSPPIKAQDVPLPTHLPPRESEALEEPDPFVDLQDVEDTGTPHYEDLDRLISELESARIVPRPDLESVPSPDLEDDIEDVVSETLARIYASQGQYDEAARVYELLAGQHPEEEDDYLQKASRMRSRASDGM